jgi:DNA-directed RNA polymerase
VAIQLIKPKLVHVNTYIIVKGKELVIDLTEDSIEDIQRKFQEALAAKQTETKHKQALDDLFTGESWQMIKATVLSMGLDKGAFLLRAQEQLTATQQQAVVQRDEAIVAHSYELVEGEEVPLVDSRYTLSNLLN